MKERLITKDDLLKYMGEEKYCKFIAELQTKMKTDNPLWIVAQDIGKPGV